ncbi:unnamed protein product [Moneuplotes crassus]|uniref:Uncharacterized protein n=1 Tax=Euplotes crassus TaxID=5936 RepID=A0AAD1U7P8_EUPCR|nr:unnamed protein product [Moneuplotes crassus]
MDRISTVHEFNHLQKRLWRDQKRLEIIKDAFINYERFTEILEQINEDFEENKLFSARCIITSKSCEVPNSCNETNDVFNIILTDIKLPAYFICKRKVSVGNEIPIQIPMILEYCELKLQQDGSIMISATSRTKVFEDSKLDNEIGMEDLDISEDYDRSFLRHQTPDRRASVNSETAQTGSKSAFSDPTELSLGVEEGSIDTIDQVKEKGLLEKINEIVAQSTKILSNHKMVEEEAKNFIDPSLLTPLYQLLVWKIINYEQKRGPKNNASKEPHVYPYKEVKDLGKEIVVNIVGIVRKVIPMRLDSENKSVKVILDSPSDQNSIDLYFTHTPKINPRKMFQEEHVVLVQNAVRKISKNLKIYLYSELLDLNDSFVTTIGSVKKVVYTRGPMEKYYPKTLIADIDSTACVRHILKLSLMIVDTIFIHILYSCKQCDKSIVNIGETDQDIDNFCKCEKSSINWKIKAATRVQDGTGSAFMYIQGYPIFSAFGINPETLKMFQKYCLGNKGEFLYPTKDDVKNKAVYQEVLKIFKNDTKFMNITAEAIPLKEGIRCRHKGVS